MDFAFGSPQREMQKGIVTRDREQRGRLRFGDIMVVEAKMVSRL